MLITVQNNLVGISTDYHSQHGEKHNADRAKAFGIRTAVVNGNDPVETYLALQTEMAFIRKTGLPVMMEFAVSRLYGHSSASGANREAGECCIRSFDGKKLVDKKLITAAACQKIWDGYDQASREAAETVRGEPVPTRESVWEQVFVGSENADWRKF